MSGPVERGRPTPFGQTRWYDRVAILVLAAGVPLPWLLFIWWLA
ncbi:MAG: hypothetical protein ABIO86_19225 [Sphingomonas sp.]